MAGEASIVGSVGAAGYNSSGNTASVGVGLPTGTQVGDLLVMVAFAGRNTGTLLNFVNASGMSWAAVASSPTPGHPNDYSIMRAYTTKVTSAGLSANYVEFTANTQNGYGGPSVGVIIYALRAPSVALDVVALTPTSALTMPTVATTKGQDQLLGVIGTSSSGITLPSAYSASQRLANGSNVYLSGGWLASPVAQPGNVGGEAIPGSSNGQAHALVLAVTGNQLPNGPAWAAGGTADGAVVDRSQPTPLAWTPSDPENDPQAGYTIRARPTGSLGAWVVIDRPTAGATPSGTIPANTLAGRCDVQVATFDAVGRGLWSPTRVITFTDVGLAPSSVPTKLDPGMLLALTQAQRAIFPAVS